MSQCIFCWNNRETVDHLFFDCVFTRSIWENVLRLIHPRKKWARNYMAKSSWILASYSDCPSSRSVAKLVFNASMYHIWFERNLRQFQNSSRTKERIIGDIIFEASMKTKSLKVPNNSRIAHYLNDCWGRNSDRHVHDNRSFTWPLPPASY